MRNVFSFILGAFFLLLAFGCQQGEDSYDDTPETNLNALWEIIDQH